MDLEPAPAARRPPAPPLPLALGPAHTRRTPGRNAVHSAEDRLVRVLGAPGRAWARQALRPLDALPGGQGAQYAATLGSALARGSSGAARRTGVSRKTVAARCARAGLLLDLDLDDLRDRALLDLALRLARGPARRALPGPAPRLAELLRSQQARAWAMDLLRPLVDDAGPLLTTVRAWIGCGGRVQDCAELIGRHPNTVRNHLSSCEELLGRRLMGRGGGAHVLVTALGILGGGEGPAGQEAAPEGPTADCGRISWYRM
ncbi:helix-turn-helix domain-containing protein [Streptomyces sp. IBSBF 2435]|uniref:helix-turn-helix domain-containing protein n=1 Tax=Streptomyces sp. IBSBF 2435 TaxID=2903531 RepID=UPI002FDBAA64